MPTMTPTTRVGSTLQLQLQLIVVVYICCYIASQVPLMVSSFTPLPPLLQVKTTTVTPTRRTTTRTRRNHNGSSFFCQRRRSLLSASSTSTSTDTSAETSTTTKAATTHNELPQEQQADPSENNNNDINDFDAVDLAYAQYHSDGSCTLSSSTLNSSSSSNENSNNNNDAMVFLHGLLGNQRNFATIATALAQSTPHAVYSVDLRNHGQSGQSNHMSLSSMAQDVVRLLTTLRTNDNNNNKNRKITLVGHSLGGKVAQAVALLYPHQIQGLVILDMAPVEYCPTQDENWKVVCDVIDLLQQTTTTLNPVSSKRDLDQALRPGIPDPALRAFCLTNWDERKGQWKVNLDAIAQQLPVLAKFDLDDTPSVSVHESSSPRQYAGDTLLIHGGQSRFVRTSHLPQIQHYFPNHMITTIRGAGHWLHAEKPEDIISLLQQYMNRGK